MKSEYELSIEEARSLEELFEVVKKVVKDFSGYTRKGVKLKTRNIGINEHAFIGGYYSFYNNAVTLNTWPLEKLFGYNKILTKYYVFHILLHEYVHSLGVINENSVRKISYLLSKKCFGKNHVATKIASDPFLLIRQAAIPAKNEKEFGDLGDIFELIEKQFRLLDKMMSNLD